MRDSRVVTLSDLAGVVAFIYLVASVFVVSRHPVVIFLNAIAFSMIIRQSLSYDRRDYWFYKIIPKNCMHAFLLLPFFLLAFLTLENYLPLIVVGGYVLVVPVGFLLDKKIIE